MINNDYYFLCLEKDCNHHSWIIQYSVFNKNFQRIYGHKVNNSLAIQLCINIPSIFTYGGVYTASNILEAFLLDIRTPVPQNFTKRLLMVAYNVMFESGYFETINDMVCFLHPIKLRQVKTTKNNKTF